MDSCVSDGQPSRQPSKWKPIRKVLVAILVMGTLAWSLSHFQRKVGQNVEPASFGQGMLHGAVMPATMPSLLLGQDVDIYAGNNSGRPYKLGYTMGVNVCGLVFFGILFSRLSRWRKRLAKPRNET